MRARRLLAGITVIAGLASGALPSSAESYAEPEGARLARLLGSAGFSEVTYRSSSAEGGTVRLEAVKARGAAGNAVEIGSVAATGIVETRDAAGAASLTMSGFASSMPGANGGAVKVGEVVVQGPQVLRRPGMPPRLKYDRLSVRDVSTMQGGRVSSDVREFEVTASRWLPGGEAPMSVAMRVKGTIPASELARVTPQVAALVPAGTDYQHETIANFDVSDGGDAEITLATGTNVLGNVQAVVRLAGVRPELFKGVAAIQDDLFAHMTKGPAAASALPQDAVMRLMADANAVRLVDMTVRLSSLEWLRRLNERESAKRGISPEAGAKTVAPGLARRIAAFASPALVQSVERELASFIVRPAAITIGLRPASPMGLADLVAAGSDPSVRPLDRLGFSVKAE